VPDLSLENEIGHERVGDGDREHENAGAPEKDHDAPGQRSRLLDRDGERHHAEIERYRDSQNGSPSSAENIPGHYKLR
jgi:hypothetical protein